MWKVKPADLLLYSGMKIDAQVVERAGGLRVQVPMSLKPVWEILSEIVRNERSSVDQQTQVAEVAEWGSNSLEQPDKESPRLSHLRACAVKYFSGLSLYLACSKTFVNCIAGDHTACSDKYHLTKMMSPLLPVQLAPEVDNVLFSYMLDPSVDFTSMIEGRLEQWNFGLVAEEPRLLEALEVTNAVVDRLHSFMDQTLDALRMMLLNCDESAEYIAYLEKTKKLCPGDARMKELVAAASPDFPQGFSPVALFARYVGFVKQLSEVLQHAVLPFLPPAVIHSDFSDGGVNSSERRRGSVNSNNGRRGSSDGRSGNRRGSDSSGGHVMDPITRALFFECVANVENTLGVLSQSWTELDAETKRFQDNARRDSIFARILSLLKR